MKRWIIIILVVVLTIALILGGSLQVILAAYPSLQQGVVPFVVATGITFVVVNIIVAVMQWFGKSPTDFLPEKSLREKDPKRFKLTRSKDPNVLAEQTDIADKTKEYEWAVAFGEAWTKAEPGNARAYRDLGEALLNLNQPEKANAIGQRLVGLQKLDFWGYRLVGQAHSKLGEWDEALRWFRLAEIYVTPNFESSVLDDLAEALEATGQIDEAIAVRKRRLPLIDAGFSLMYAQDHLAELELIAGKLKQSSGV